MLGFSLLESIYGLSWFFIDLSFSRCLLSLVAPVSIGVIEASLIFPQSRLV